MLAQERDSEMVQLGGRRNGNTYAGFPGGVEGVIAAVKIATLAASAGGYSI